jgi:hypothetical protein
MSIDTASHPPASRLASGAHADLLASMSKHSASIRQPSSLSREHDHHAGYAPTPLSSREHLSDDVESYSQGSETGNDLTRPLLEKMYKTAAPLTTLLGPKKPTTTHLGLMAGALCLLGLVYFTLVAKLPEVIVGPTPPLKAQDNPHLVDADTLLDALGDVIPSTSSKSIIIPNDPTHVLLAPSALPPTSKLLTPLLNRPPHSVLSEFYTTGRLTHAPRLPNTTLDLVYLYVDASSPFFRASQERKLAEEGFQTNRASGLSRHWRNNGELRGAIRSGAASLGDNVGTIHVLSGDYGLGDTTDTQGDATPLGTLFEGWRVGQIPAWLDWNEAGKEQSGLKWHFHSEVFRLPVDGGVDADNGREKEEEWRRQALPNFDSFAIESRIGWIEGLGDNLYVT